MNDSPPTASSGPIDKFLNFIEYAGNKLPDPAVLFLLLMIGVWLISWPLSKVEFNAFHPVNRDTVSASVAGKLSFANLKLGDSTRKGSEQQVVVSENCEAIITDADGNEVERLSVPVGSTLSMSDGDITVVMDADLQDPPEIVPQMIELWRQGYDVVNAVRTKRKENWLLRLSYKLFYRIYRPMVDIEVAVDSGDFSLMDRKVVKAMNQLPEKNRFVRGLRSWVGFSSIQWQYERQERAAGETKYSLGRLMKLAFDGIFNFSFKPLSFLLFCGAFFFAVSVLLGIMFITSRLTGLELLGQSASAVPGFTTIAILMLFFGSVQLLSVGIVGEYLARIYQEVKDRPTFVIESVVGKEQ